MRLDDLSIEQRKKLVSVIDQKKRGVLDCEWDDIVRSFQLDESPETIRKSAVGIALAESCGMLHEANYDDCNSYIERQKINDIRRDAFSMLREESRSQLLREAIHDAIKGLPEIKSYITPENNFISDIDRKLVIGVGDFHYGAQYSVEGLYGETINRYSPEIFDDRMNKLLSDIVDISRKEKPNELLVMIAGDMLEGMIHTSQLSKIKYGVVESAMKLGESLCVWLNDLYNKTRVPISVYAVRGNHGEIRPLGSKAGQFPEENMERIVMHYIGARLNTHHYINVMDDCPMWKIVDVCGYKFLLLHGNGQDMEQIARDMVNIYNEKIDVFMVGHLHKSQTFTAGIVPGGNVLIERVPSLCGIDPYAQSKGYGSPPGATVIVMEKGYGRRCVYPIKL